MRSNKSQLEIVIEGTRFIIRSERQGGLGVELLATAVSSAWPKFFEIFGLKLPDVTINDIDAAIGGGPGAAFEVGIYTSETIDVPTAKYLESTLGWTPRSNTQAYIEDHYSKFPNPIQAYVNDMVAHELGHPLFGWGLTAVKSFSHNDAWFALGLGLVYDRLVWERLNEMPSPLFSAVVDVWERRFANISELDQRLIAPDESNDSRFGLNRVQTYGHGKSFAFLKYLRSQIGSQAFDNSVTQYISSGIGSPILYDEFISSFFDGNQLKCVRQAESEFAVR